PGQRRPMAARPMHMLILADLEQQLELLLEELIVIFEVIAKERERLDKRSTAGHDFRTSAREQIQCCELLEYPNGIIGAQDVDGTREPNSARALGCRREHDGRRRHDEIG